MTASLIEKARANRVAALAHLAERKSNLVSLNDFRDAAARKAAQPVVGFVSSRSLAEDERIAA